MEHMLTDEFLFLGIKDMQFPQIAGKYEGKLLIVAGGRCVWDDLSQFAVPGKHGQRTIEFDGDVLCVNDIGMHLPCKVDHWYSNDGLQLPRWKAARRPEYQRFVDEDAQLHTFYRPAKSSNLWVWPWPGHGGSGLNSVYTGLALGYDEILIAGMPSDNSGHYFDPPWVRTNFTREVPPQKDCEINRWWKTARNQLFKGRVKAMSGRTAAWV